MAKCSGKQLLPVAGIFDYRRGGVNLGLSFPPKNVKNLCILLFFNILNIFWVQ